MLDMIEAQPSQLVVYRRGVLLPSYVGRAQITFEGDGITRTFKIFG